MVKGKANEIFYFFRHFDLTNNKQKQINQQNGYNERVYTINVHKYDKL